MLFPGRYPLVSCVVSCVVYSSSLLIVLVTLFIIFNLIGFSMHAKYCSTYLNSALNGLNLRGENIVVKIAIAKKLNNFCNVNLFSVCHKILLY